jgi:3'(2'), 5'-bisphosphate nucleotidase
VSDPVLEAMIDVAREAAAEIASFYRRHERSGIAVDEKAPGDPVTEADRAANDRICRALAARFPDAGIIAEESVPPDRDEIRDVLSRPRVFFVDPLDGTREFVDRNPEFATMIGLAEDGRAVAGVVATPLDGMVYAGSATSGAFADGGGARRPLAVSHAQRFAEARMLVSRSHPPSMVLHLRRRLGVSELVPCGSAGLKVVRVASGAADFYAHDGPGMKHWDTCGPEALLVAAGGRLSDLDGGRVDYRSEELDLRRGLLASNGVLHPGVLSAVGWARRQG